MTHIYTLRLKSGDVFRFTSHTDEFTVEVDGLPIAGCHRDAANRFNVGIYPDTENFQPVLAIDPPQGKDPKDMTFDELLVASSLGSPEAWALVQSTPPHVKAEFDKQYQARVDKLVAAAEPELAGDSSVERLAEEEPTEVDLESMKIYAPWDEDQVKQLQAFQDFGNFHAFTCGNDHGRPVNLMPDEEGWYCPVEDCEYTQDWAWIAMLDQRNLLNSQFGHPNAHGCTCKVVNTDAGWFIEENDPNCKMHPQLGEPTFDTEKSLEELHEWIDSQPKDAIPQRRHHGVTREELDEAIISPVYRTKTGKALTDADIQRLADEAVEGSEEVQKTEGSAASEEPSAATQPERLTAPHSDYPTEPMTEEEEAAEVNEGEADLLAKLKDADCDGGVDDDDMTEEQFDAAMAEGEQVQVEVQLDHGGRGDVPEENTTTEG